MKWFYRNFVILLIVLIAAIGIMMAICIIGRIAITHVEECVIHYSSKWQLERRLSMTANQIEYWKLNETRRHNIETENMERPYKESLTKLNQEYILNQPYVRALSTAQERAAYAQEAAGYASAAANYAAAELSYERINTEITQQGLNLEKSNTEQSVQRQNDARTAGYVISNEQQQYITSQYQYNGLIASDKVDYLSFNTTNRQKGAKATVNREWYNPQGAAANAFNSGMYTGAILFGN